MARFGRLTLTPWAQRALGQDDADRLTLRCAEMGVRVGVLSSQHLWSIVVSSDMTKLNGYARVPQAEHRHRRTGPLAVLIAEELDHYQAEQTWTDEELLVIAAQSGMDVARA